MTVKREQMFHVKHPKQARQAAAVIALIVLLGVSWINATIADAPAPSASQQGVATSASTPASAEGVSEAAYRAAERDDERASDTQRANLDPAAFERVTVRHVVDGDTLAVATDDGEHVSVRLVGMDTPESVAPQEERNCEEGVVASNRMKELVNSGDTLWLQYDTSITDKYGRLLAYVWRTPPASAEEANDPAFIACDMLNAMQVIDGYGQAKTYRPDTFHDTLFKQWGSEALDAHRGVTAKWA